MLKVSTQWNQQFIGTCFPKIIGCLKKSKTDEYNYAKTNLVKETIERKTNEQIRKYWN